MLQVFALAIRFESMGHSERSPTSKSPSELCPLHLCQVLLLSRSKVSPHENSVFRAFDCNLEEAENPSLDSYPTLGAFFRRRLKPGARPVAEAPLVSPADGKVLHWGVVGSDDAVEQVKGVTYSLKTFLGERLELDAAVVPACGMPDAKTSPLTSSTTNTLKAEEDASRDKPDEGETKSDATVLRRTKTVLHQAVIYLAPGDYHGFHSPTDWKVLARRHFPGELLSVNPRIARAIANLFALNERVAYLGVWEHGFFSMTAVGATNVGSVKVDIDPQLATNEASWERDTFHQVKSSAQLYQILCLFALRCYGRMG